MLLGVWLLGCYLSKNSRKISDKVMFAAVYATSIMLCLCAKVSAILVYDMLDLLYMLAFHKI